MEAQRFPEDYDGILAGAPANYWTHLLTKAVADAQATTLEPASYIPSAKLPAIAQSGECRVRRPGRRDRRSAGRPEAVSLRPGDARLPGRRLGRVLDGAAGDRAEEAVRGAARLARARDLPRVRAGSGGRRRGLGTVDHRPGAGQEPAVRLRHRLLRQHGLREGRLGLPEREPRAGPEGGRGEDGGEARREGREPRRRSRHEAGS